MEKQENINIGKKIENLLKLIISFSSFILTIILSNRFLISHAIIGAVLSFIIMLIIMKKIEIRAINKKILVASIFISSYMMRYFLGYTYERMKWFANIVMRIIKLDVIQSYINMAFGVFALPALVFFVYLFIKKIIPEVKKFFRDLTKVEKRYLVIMSCIGIVLCIGISFVSTAFSKPYLDGNLQMYDVVYTSDSGALTYNDTYFNVSYFENDIRQPLFGVFALPFSVIAKLLSEFAFFLQRSYAYEIIMMIMQFCITAVTTIMIGKLLNLEEKDKKFLYLLFSLSFPYLIFNLILEQYVIGLFYLILTIYVFYNYDIINYTYIGTVGTMITSGIVFPLITKFKNLKQYVKDIFKCFLAFVTVFVVSGQFGQILTTQERLKYITQFNIEVTVFEKLLQFLNFVQSIFISAAGHIVNSTYQLCTVQNISIIGIVILVIMLISAIINRKNKMARISFLWVIFSFIILFVVGWGTSENGLILYTLYFTWAYLILYYLFLKKMLTNRKIFIAILLLTILIMAIFNIRELFNIISFAIRYY